MRQNCPEADQLELELLLRRALHLYRCSCGMSWRQDTNVWMAHSSETWFSVLPAFLSLGRLQPRPLHFFTVIAAIVSRSFGVVELVGESGGESGRHDLERCKGWS